LVFQFALITLRCTPALLSPFLFLNDIISTSCNYACLVNTSTVSCHLPDDENLLLSCQLDETQALFQSLTTAKH